MSIIFRIMYIITGDNRVRVWVTNVGRQPYAVVNPIWMWLIMGYGPIDSVVLIYNRNVNQERAQVERLLSRVFRSFNIKVSIYREEASEEWARYTDDFLDILDEYSEYAREIIVDLTPGRKFMAISIFNTYSILKKRRIRVVYLHLLDPAYQQKPLPVIPLSLQRFIIADLGPVGWFNKLKIFLYRLFYGG